MTRNDFSFALYKALEWAMQYVPEKIDTAAGVSCKHCKGGIDDENYNGLTTDKITHEDKCLWKSAVDLLAKVKAGGHDAP